VTEKLAVLLLAGAAVGVLIWLSRPPASGTRIVPVAGLRG